MFSQLFGILAKAKQVKDVISQFILLADRADDDLDNDGKAEIQNLKEELDALAKDIFADAKEHFRTAIGIFNRAERLVEHVKTGK